MSKHGLSVQERLHDRKVVTPEGCWLWTGSLSNGYGNINLHGKTVKVHRLAYRTWVGELKDEEDILHSCDNPACFRPKHLRIGDDAENALDKVTRGRHPGVKLTVSDVVDIRWVIGIGAVQRKVAKEYGVSASVICEIYTRKAWGHVV